MEQTIEAVNHVIRNRRSIFPPSYLQKDIPDEVLLAILENANYAPTHKITEPWRFVVYKGESLKTLAGFFTERYRTVTPPESFSQAKYEAAGEKVLKSNVVVLICAELHPEKLPEWEETAAVACAVQNMWLTATAYGIGSYWSSPGVLDLLAKFAGIPENQKCLGLYFMGYHDGTAPGPSRRTPMENKITWA